jgi:hypothetical protein
MADCSISHQWYRTYGSYNQSQVLKRKTSHDMSNFCATCTTSQGTLMPEVMVYVLLNDSKYHYTSLSHLQLHPWVRYFQHDSLECQSVLLKRMNIKLQNLLTNLKHAANVRVTTFFGNFPS